MKTFSSFFFILTLICSIFSGSLEANNLAGADPKIAGTLTYAKMMPGDQFDGKVILELYQGDKLFAQTEILRPRFPQAYLVGPKNAVTPGVPFEGEFRLSARLVGDKGTKIAQASNAKVLAGARGIMLELSEN